MVKEAGSIVSAKDCHSLTMASMFSAMNWERVMKIPSVLAGGLARSCIGRHLSSASIALCRAALHPQPLCVAGHFQISASDFPAVAVEQVGQTFPVDATGRSAAVQFLVVDHGFDRVKVRRCANDPLHWITGLR